MSDKEARAVSIEVDGRQRYLFETDKLQEMLGASRLIDQMREEAQRLFQGDLHIFSLVSGEIRAWADYADRGGLLDAAWGLRDWLQQHGIEHSVAWLECGKRHFCEASREDPEAIRAAARAPEGQEPEIASLAWVHHALGERIRRRKDAKADEDARPTCSLFANCRIHGSDAANRYDPDHKESHGGKEPRRELVGYRARAKYEAWKEEKGREKGFYQEHLLKPVAEVITRRLGAVPTRAVTFHDLADRQDEPDRGDSYMAFVCADGDAMGALLSCLDWNSQAWKDGRAPWKRNLDFSVEYDACVKEAFYAALRDVVGNHVLPQDGKKLREFLEGHGYRVPLPLLPQLLGGDDLWMVCDRTVALDFVQKFCDTYEKKAKTDTLAKALEVAKGLGMPPGEALTVSVGIAFAKAGHPAHAMAEAAKNLLDSAKSLRKAQVWGRPLPDEQVSKEGCLDWHWIASSLSQTVREAREKGLAYTDEAGNVMLLTSRPWTVRQSAAFEEAARAFEKVPRRKREQMESILRRGLALSRLAWEDWWKGLEPVSVNGTEKSGQAFFRDDFKPMLPQGWQLGDDASDKTRLDPWIELHENGDTGGPGVFATPLLDLLELHDVLKDSPPDRTGRRAPREGEGLSPSQLSGDSGEGADKTGGDDAKD